MRVEKARALWKDKQLAKAKEELAAAFKLDPKSPDAAALQAQMK